MGDLVGQKTNNEAEYLALIWGLDLALLAGVRQLECNMDSELIVRQIQGRYKVKKPHLQPLFRAVLQRMHKFDKVHVQHVRRHFNKEADAIGRMAQERGTRWVDVWNVAASVDSISCPTRFT